MYPADSQYLNFTHLGLQYHFQCNNVNNIWVNDLLQLVLTRGASIQEEVRHVWIWGVTQQLLFNKSHDFLAVFALAQSKINHIAYLIFGLIMWEIKSWNIQE